MSPPRFRVVKTDPSSRARLGLLETAHGTVETPAFMPVGTQGTVKGMTPRDLREIGVSILLANTYHLLLRPGPDTIARRGGLHRFMAWDRPILTDSGGFQVWSLAPLREVGEEGVRFRSHLDGSPLELTPERAVAVQEALGSDILMPLDECISVDASAEEVLRSTERTHRWAERSLEARARPELLLFGIGQGGGDEALRRESARRLARLPFDGFAVGGVGIGEEPEATWRSVRASVEEFPADRPRYLMGMGTLADLRRGVALGVDLFDCVLPTRNARNGQAFTASGVLNLRSARFAEDPAPIEADCPCETCRTFSRAYLRHLFVAREMLAGRLTTLHNLSRYVRTVASLREALREGRAVDSVDSTR